MEEKVLELEKFELRKENLGKCRVMDGDYTIMVNPPWNQYVKGLASQAVKNIYISAEADLSKMLLLVDRGINLRVFDYTPSEKEKKIIIDLLGEECNGRHTRLGNKQYRIA